MFFLILFKMNIKFWCFDVLVVKFFYGDIIVGEF